MATTHTFYTVGGAIKTRVLTRKTAIREHCIHCMQSRVEPRYCTSKLCPLYPFRLGVEGNADDEEDLYGEE
jgi:hypothetical protein